MRELTSIEANWVAGSASCIDITLWNKLQNTAINDGYLIAAVGSVLTAGFVYGVSGSLVIGAGCAFLGAPYAFMGGYFYSSAWNIVNSQ